jgi:hypothetical protein
VSTIGRYRTFAAFAEDGQAATVVVLELHSCQLALAQAEPEEQKQRHAITLACLRGGASSTQEFRQGE